MLTGEKSQKDREREREREGGEHCCTCPCTWSRMPAEATGGTASSLVSCGSRFLEVPIVGLKIQTPVNLCSED